MTTDSTYSTGGDSSVDPPGGADTDAAVGDAVPGVSGSENGAPTPTGSIPPGPATLDSDDVVDPTELPPLGERMY